MLAISHFRLFWRFFVFLVLLLVLCHHFRNIETIAHKYLAMEHVHHELLEITGMIRQEFSSNKNKIIAVRECSLFGINFDILNTATQHYVHTCNLSLVRTWHLSMTQRNGSVSNLYSANCSGAPSVVWNPHLILVHLVQNRSIWFLKQPAFKVIAF